VKLIESDDGSVEWSKSYPLEGADSTSIAAEVAAEVKDNVPSAN